MSYNLDPDRIFIFKNSIRRAMDDFSEKINNIGGIVYIVGGMVRDYLMDVSSNKIDLDLCITGIPYEVLAEKIVEFYPHTKIDHVGSSFGILNIAPGAPFGVACQISIPRADKNRTDVAVDHTLPIESDLERRDFTINALAIKVEKKYSLIGDQTYLVDIKKKILKAVGKPEDRFNEDPLRILRGLQFISRFNLKVDADTEKALTDCAPLLQTVSIDRLESEFIKGCSTVSTYNKFIVNLEKTGIGQALFGADFKPVKIRDAYGTDSMVEIYWIVFMFINGGDYTKLSPKREYKILNEAVRGVKQYLDSKKKSDILPMITACRRMTDASIRHIHEFFSGLHEKKYQSQFSKPLIPAAPSYYDHTFKVTGKHLEAAFKSMNREVPYKDFNHIMADLINDAQTGVADYTNFHDQNSITEYLVKKSYK